MTTETNDHAKHRFRMRERYNRCGMDSFAEHEVLEVYLYRCFRRINTNDIAHSLLRQFASLSGVFSKKNAKEYRKVPFVGEKTAFTLRESAENMENSVLSMLRAQKSYDAGSVMVFSRFMLKRLPEDHVLVLRYVPDGAFVDCVSFPASEIQREDFILNCLAVSKNGEDVHIRFGEKVQWTLENCLKISMELCVYTRKLRSVHRICGDGKIEKLYE